VNAISEAFRPGDIVRLHALAGSTNDVDDDAFLARRHQRIETPGHIDVAKYLQIPGGAPARLVDRQYSRAGLHPRF
jgi:hypothetical protein